MVFEEHSSNVPLKRTSDSQWGSLKPDKSQKLNPPPRRSNPAAGKPRYEVLSECDPIADYRLSIEHINLNTSTVAWSRLSGADQLYKHRYNLLSARQRILYFKLISFLRVYVESSVFGVSGFNDLDTVFVWNWHTWHGNIVKLVEMVERDLDPSDDNCWLSLFSATKDNAIPKIHVTPGVVKFCVDTVTKSRNRIFRFFQITQTSYKSSVARLVAVLKHGPPSADMQTSHLCHNSPQKCFNPHHVCWENDLSNKSRNLCVNGARFYCPHVPKCIWTNVKGVFLPHRNIGTIQVCDCSLDCHNARILPGIALDEVGDDGEDSRV